MNKFERDLAVGQSSMSALKWRLSRNDEYVLSSAGMVGLPIDAQPETWANLLSRSSKHRTFLSAQRVLKDRLDGAQSFLESLTVCLANESLPKVSWNGYVILTLS